ncbi:hypothetical protein DRO42_08700 [Candidatus Bathyarchaeota archaeon]|nr:MAG: hypothetical protein DRO42_08700 [Candidatus Bathyarchaeota archaeon]
MRFIANRDNNKDGENHLKVDWKGVLVDQMRKGLVINGLILFTIGVALGLYASQRDCLIAFITRGYMSFWTGIEILGGLLALTGIIIALTGYIKKIRPR